MNAKTLIENVEPTELEIQEFSELVDGIVIKDDISYLEALVSIAEQYNVEVEVIAAMISENIKSKLFSEAMKHNMIKKIAQLELV